jgi:hypothetical protein
MSSSPIVPKCVVYSCTVSTFRTWSVPDRQCPTLTWEEFMSADIKYVHSVTYLHVRVNVHVHVRVPVRVHVLSASMFMFLFMFVCVILLWLFQRTTVGTWTWT